MARIEVTINGETLKAHVTTGRERPPTARPGTFAVHDCLTKRKGRSLTHLATGKHVMATRLVGTGMAALKELENLPESEWQETV